MKLLQTYSRNTSVDIKHKPKLVEKFFPLGGIDKYITIQNKSGMPAKDYSYFNEVISLISTTLEKHGIKIIHLGQDSPPLINVINLNNQTSISQAAFILKKSSLHFGVDSWMCHYCGAEEIPLVSLYGNTTVDNHSPYFYNKDKTIFLESHRNGNKATFAREEMPKTVDLILPEDIVQSVLKLLNIEWNYDFKTILIGPNYQNKIVELVPDCVVDVNKLGVTVLPVRMDYLYNLDNLFKQLQICKCVILTDKIIPIEPLIQLRPNIQEVLYKITPEHNPDFVKVLQQAKIPCKLWSELPDNKLNDIKLSYLDFPGIIHKKNTEMPEILKNKDLGRIHYKSSRFLLSAGKIFNSFWDYKADRSVQDFNGTILPIMDINLSELFIDADNLYFLEKIA